MSERKVQCLVLACGNTLRSDDGVGPRLAAWAEERFRAKPEVRVVSLHQWTPDLAEEIAAAESVLFVDCSLESAPGRVSLIPVEANEKASGSTAHQLDPPELLGLARSLFGSMPAHALLLTVGACSTELGETFSDRVEAALPRAQGILEKVVLRTLAN
ncbi:MAG: hydrogenase maturation protease [Terracidiphilus sp.]